MWGILSGKQNRTPNRDDVKEKEDGASIQRIAVPHPIGKKPVASVNQEYPYVIANAYPTVKDRSFYGSSLVNYECTVKTGGWTKFLEMGATQQSWQSAQGFVFTEPVDDLLVHFQLTMFIRFDSKTNTDSEKLPKCKRLRCSLSLVKDKPIKTIRSQDEESDSEEEEQAGPKYKHQWLIPQYIATITPRTGIQTYPLSVFIPRLEANEKLSAAIHLYEIPSHPVPHTHSSEVTASVTAIRSSKVTTPPTTESSSSPSPSSESAQSSSSSSSVIDDKNGPPLERNVDMVISSWSLLGHLK